MTAVELMEEAARDQEENPDLWRDAEADGLRGVQDFAATTIIMVHDDDNSSGFEAGVSKLVYLMLQRNEGDALGPFTMQADTARRLGKKLRKLAKRIEKG